MKSTLIALFVFLGILSLTFVAGRCSNSSDASSYENVIRAKETEVKQWQDDAKHWRSRGETAEITSRSALKELSKYDERFKGMSQDFAIMKKSMKNLESASFTGTESHYHITNITNVKDTALPPKIENGISGILETGKYFKFTDPAGWFTAEGICVDNQPLELTFNPHDSLAGIVVKNRRLFRRPKYTWEIKSLNPNTRIRYSESVIVKKSKFKW